MSSDQRLHRSRCAKILTPLAAFASIVLLAGGAIQTRADQSESTEVFTTELEPGSSERFAKNREEIFKAFYARGLDLTRGYEVTNVTVQKDNMTFLLKQGTVFLMKPIEGEITGAAFVGDGVAKMTPPNRTERYMLNKYYEKETLAEPFSEVVFRFSDGTQRALIAGAQPMDAPSGRAERAAEIFGDRNSWLNGTRSLSLEMQHLENRINGSTRNDFFVAVFHSSEHDWITFTHNPMETIENILAISKTLGARSKRYTVIWTDWHRKSDYGPSGHYVLHPDRDGAQLLKVRHSEMNITIPTTDRVDWEGSLRIEPQVDGLRCLRFDLANNADFTTKWHNDHFFPIKLLSVMNEAGEPLEYMHKKDQLLVNLRELTAAGTAITLRFAGTAKVIVQLTAQSFGLIQAPWFPKYGYLGGRYTFDWTVRVPRPYLATGSGNLIREFEDKDRRQNVVQLGSDVPVNFPWIIFGRFNKAEHDYVGEESGRTVPMSIHSFPLMTSSITDPTILAFFGYTQPTTVELRAPVRKLKGFFGESVEVVKLFENIYGPYPYDELHIAQMAPQLNFGQAPPGFLQLSGLAFASQSIVESDFIHGFLSHEIAHQWWGNQVGWASGDDEWLSEAFAEYAAGIFVKEFQGAPRFQQKLKEWRTMAKYSDKEGPIAAANTLSGPNAGGHRAGLLYNKGPYVLHMLRVQLDDEKYSEVMRSVQERYRHKNISTEMLLAEVNRVTGQDYTFFFDQWFWDVGIPTFEYSWRSKRRDDGKFVVSVQIRQRGDGPVKRVLMPIHIHLKKGEVPTQYRPVLEASQEIKLLLPVEPKDVTLDDERTLLAEYVKKK